MKAKLLLFPLVYLLSHVSFAQTEMFKVLASKGTNKATSNNTDWKPIKVGDKLLQQEKITLDENSYLALAYSNGKTIELKQKGTYEVAKLADELKAQNSSVSKKYVDFVVGEMTNQNEDIAKNRHKYMAVTGSVERGGYAITLKSPTESFVLSAPIRVQWKESKGVKTYVVVVCNLFEEVLLQQETSDSSAVLDLSKIKPSEQKNLLWWVYAKGNTNVTSNKITLKFYPESKSAELNKEVAELKKDLTQQSALNKIVLASFYEQNKLTLNAMENYQEAIVMEPEVEDYKALYGKFLQANNIAVAKQ